jgi:general secretion pathway protein I
MSRHGQAGFTLIEMIVGLAVLSLGLVALLNVTGENVRAAGTIREAVVGQIVAENHLVEAMLAGEELEAGTTTGEEGMAGRRWTWRRIVSPTANAGMQRIDVSVHPADGADQGRAAATLTAFRGVKP